MEITLLLPYYPGPLYHFYTYDALTTIFRHATRSFGIFAISLVEWSRVKLGLVAAKWPLTEAHLRGLGGMREPRRGRLMERDGNVERKEYWHVKLTMIRWYVPSIGWMHMSCTNGCHNYVTSILHMWRVATVCFRACVSNRIHHILLCRIRWMLHPASYLLVDVLFRDIAAFRIFDLRTIDPVWVIKTFRSCRDLPYPRYYLFLPLSTIDTHVPGDINFQWGT